MNKKIVDVSGAQVEVSSKVTAEQALHHYMRSISNVLAQIDPGFMATLVVRHKDHEDGGALVYSEDDLAKAAKALTMQAEANIPVQQNASTETTQ